ncbi:MAG: hypothetical protein Q7T44_06735 [Parvibaculum sp.]|nr:hypothetical protein [Parvibaculum sp.]
MRKAFGVLVASVLLSSVAFAGDDPFANYYDNTVTVTNATGARAVLINKDGSYTQKLADGTTATGTWKIDGANGCFMSGEPDAKPYCVPAETHAVGDTWDLTAPDGTAEKATLTAGR